MIRNTALIVPREGNIEFQNVPKASVFCLGDSFLPFLPPSFPLPIPLPALATAVQRQCLDVQGRTRVYTVQRVTVQRVTGRRGEPHTGGGSCVCVVLVSCLVLVSRLPLISRDAEAEAVS